MSIFGCAHRWGFPWRDSESHYSLPWDSQITCSKCGAERLYNWKAMMTGPEVTASGRFMATALFILSHKPQEATHETATVKEGLESHWETATEDSRLSTGEPVNSLIN